MRERIDDAFDDRFIQLGIPAVSYAPRAASHAARKAIKSRELVDAARVYAAIAVDLANQPRTPWTPLGSHLNAVTDRTGLTVGDSAARHT